MKISNLLAGVAAISSILIAGCGPVGPVAVQVGAPPVQVVQANTFQCGDVVCTSPAEVCLHVRAGTGVASTSDGSLGGGTRPGVTGGIHVELPAHCQPMPEQCRANPTCSCLGSMVPCHEYDGHVTLGDVDRVR